MRPPDSSSIASATRSDALPVFSTSCIWLFEMPIRRPKDSSVSDISERSEAMDSFSAMRSYSDDPNFLSTGKVRIGRNDCILPISYHPNMARKTAPKSDFEPDWYLVEWMRSKKMTQAALSKATGWSKATANDIYHGKTAYYREILNKVAGALQIAPWELLMHPEQANAIKRMRAGALQLAADNRADFIGEPQVLPITGTDG